MAISFNSIPNSTRTPFTYIEFDNSRAVPGPVQQTFKNLVIGQKLSSGTATALVPIRVTSLDQAAGYFGKNSMLYGMLKALFANNNTTETWVLPVEDAAAGVKATGKVTITGTATASGVIYLYVAGRRIEVAVTSGDVNTAIATAMAAAINADDELPVTAAVNGVNANEVDLEFDHKGLVGNFIDVRVGYYQDEKAVPAGVTLAITAFSGGTTNPDLTNAIAAIPDEQYNVIVVPYTDSSNLAKLEAEMDSRWGPQRQIEGHVFTAADDSHSNLGTLGDSRNSKHLTIVESHDSPSPIYAWAGAVAGLASFYLAIDQARPLQTLEIKGVLAEEKADQFTIEERNLLLFDGISTHYVDASGLPRVERLITTYKLNALGGADVSYLDVNTLFTLSYLRYDLRTYILNKYPRHKLADDGIRVAPGQAIMTPKVAKAEAVKKFRDWESLGLVENFDAFKEGLIVERNALDRNRLDWVLTPDLMNQLRINAIQIGFIL